MPIDIGVIFQEFDYAERALADRRSFTIEAGSIAVPGLAFTLASCDPSGCTGPRLEWNGSAARSLHAVGGSVTLVRKEVSKSILRSILVSGVPSNLTLSGLRDHLMNAFAHFGGSVRPATLDDGDWELISHQREVPLQLSKPWDESDRAAHYFYINVPARAAELTIQTSAGTGNADLYVRFGGRPTSIVFGGYDARSANAGNTETVTIQNPASGLWCLMLPTSTAYSGIELLGRVTVDEVAPAVSITSPTSGAVYTTVQTVKIAAVASDNVSVTRVEFYDGGTLKATDTTALYGCGWSFTSAANGPHNWTALAYDTVGNVATSSPVVLTVSIDIAPPTVAITSPVTDQSFTTPNLTVRGTANDPGNPSTGVDLVEVQVSGGGWLAATGTTNWSRSVTLAPNSNLIEARSRDGAGNTSTFASVTVTYTPNRAPTTPTNVIPSNGAIDQPPSVTLQACPFSDPDSDGHAASRWQALDSAGIAVVWESNEDTVNLTSRAVPSGALAHSTTYHWQVSYKDSRGAWSSNSAPTAFTTRPPSLAASKQGTNIVLTWSTNAVGFVLVGSTNLAPTAVWGRVSPSAAVVSGQNVVSNSLSGPKNFYQLRR